MGALLDQKGDKMPNYKKVTVIMILVSILVKLSGFFRESVVARQFGANEVTDGYLLAFSLITLVVIMTTSGFNNVFLPMYTRNKAENLEKANQNAVALLNISFIVFLVLGAIVYVLAPFILSILLQGGNPDTELIAIRITRIFALFLSLIAVNGILESYLQSKKIFVPIQFSKLLVALFSALFPLFLANIYGIYSIAYGFIFGTCLAIAIQFFYLMNDNFKWGLSVNIDKHFSKTFVVLLIPAILNSTLGFINTFVDKLFATNTIYGAVTYLNHASLLISIPNAIFATTIAVIIFTMLSEAIQKKGEFEHTLFSGMQISYLVFFPIAFGMIIISEPLVAFIFERGAFTPIDTRSTYLAVLMYSPLIVTQGIQLIVSKSLYAQQRTSTIFKISFTTIFLNVILNFLLIKPFGYLGLALSSSFVSLYYLAATSFFLYKDVGVSEGKRALLFMGKVFYATMFMALPLYFIANSAVVVRLYSLWQIIVLVPLGAALYVIGTYFFNREGFHKAMEFVRK